MTHSWKKKHHIYIYNSEVHLRTYICRPWTDSHHRWWLSTDARLWGEGVKRLYFVSEWVRWKKVLMIKIQCKSTMSLAKTHTKQRNNTLILRYGKHFFDTFHFKKVVSPFTLTSLHQNDCFLISWWSWQRWSVCGESLQRDEHTRLAKFHYIYI